MERLAILKSILEICLRHSPSDAVSESAVPGLILSSFRQPRLPVCSVAKPGIGIVLQGSKDVFLGSSRWTYGPSEFLLISADLPLTSYSSDATQEKPYVGIAVLFEPALILEVAAQAEIELESSANDVPGLTIERLTESLSEIVSRLVRLLDRPEDAKMLAPLIHRELLYQLLKTPAAGALHRLGMGESKSCALAAVRWLRDNFDKPLSIEQLAEDLSVSPSSLHHQFKALTSTSPLQYQKALRLQEARRLMMSGDFGASDVAFQVGYNSSSQFSREYKRQFGSSPSQERERVLSGL